MQTLSPIINSSPIFRVITSMINIPLGLEDGTEPGKSNANLTGHGFPRNNAGKLVKQSEYQCKQAICRFSFAPEKSETELPEGDPNIADMNAF